MGPVTVPLDAPGWPWRAADVVTTRYRGRRCIRFAESVGLVAPLDGVVLTDGVVELDLAVERERAFHGVLWRIQDDENYESFFVRPHQVGNPDAVQYTPVFNGVSAWQLYHGPGYWAPVAFPIGRWFRIRVAFGGQRGEVHLDDGAQPALAIGELKMPARPGRIGIMIGGPGLAVSRFAYSSVPPPFVGRASRPRQARGVVSAWWVSDAFAESSVRSAALPKARVANRRWTLLESEPTGLVNLARVSAIRGTRNTVFARITIRSPARQVRAMDLGFSDRAVVYLNGQALFRADDTYRSRDYRFLGSLGFFDTVFLPLVRGENELVVAVSETFGGWGIQARFPDLSGLVIS